MSTRGRSVYIMKEFMRFLGGGGGGCGEGRRRHHPQKRSKRRRFWSTMRPPPMIDVRPSLRRVLGVDRVNECMSE